MTIWFTSDNHFSHQNILKFCRDTRRGDTVEEMNNLMIEKFNELIKPSDIVYFIGDFSFADAQTTRDIIRQIPGHKHLIFGNHDQVIRKNFDIQRMFESTQDYKRLKIDKKHIMLFHFPIASYDMMGYGSFHLHGHTHGNYQHEFRGFDVGIDNRADNLMAPWAWDELREIIENKPFPTYKND